MFTCFFLHLQPGREETICRLMEYLCSLSVSYSIVIVNGMVLDAGYIDSHLTLAGGKKDNFRPGR